MKKILLGSLILMLAIGFSAFSTTGIKQVRDSNYSPEWFELIPNGDPNEPNDYEPVEDRPCDGNSLNVCGVFVIEDAMNPGHPDLSASPAYVYKDL